MTKEFMMEIAILYYILLIRYRAEKPSNQKLPSAATAGVVAIIIVAIIMLLANHIFL